MTSSFYFLFPPSGTSSLNSKLKSLSTWFFHLGPQEVPET